MKTKTQYSLMPLRDLVMFPYMVSTLFVGRDYSIKALEYALKNNKKILLVSQKVAKIENPKTKDIYDIGVLASVLQMINLPDKTVKVLVEGVQVNQISNLKNEDEFFIADAKEIVLNIDDIKTIDLTKLMHLLKNKFKQYVKINPKIPHEIAESISLSDAPDLFAYNIATHLDIDLKLKQQLLSETSLNKLLNLLLDNLDTELHKKDLDKKIQTRVKKQMDKNQREYYLNEKIKAIYKELGTVPKNYLEEIKDLKYKIENSGAPKNIKNKLYKELEKLRAMSPSSAESSVVRTYIDTVLEVPWKEETTIKTDINIAKKSLDLDHYGLDEVKKRILEYLAVQQRVGQLKGPILCLVGPPGVGKTSLGESIAKATGRKFVRMALGGVRDEAEIRGHRRTYIGSMPGRIIHNISRVGVKNPLFLLDEIDKMAQDFRGDPASALLEVLDPEQNHKFNDHYLEVDYDLSSTMFIATSNSMNIPTALLDRMEIIRISGYTEDEKLHIAKNHLIPRQFINHGLTKKEWSFTDNVLLNIIQHYTKEAGVRNLDREIAKLMRKSVKKLATDKSIKKISINLKNIDDFLGVKKFHHGTADKQDQIGQVTGLAWTSVGGELLTIEAILVPGKGKFIITGQLGDVMQESIKAAMSVIRSRADSLNIADNFYKKQDIHIHVPEGATPKDGPSAGVGMCTALVSVLTNTKVKASVAMTGEITLRGEVLPIGGLKEKLLAAHRAGIKTVIIPKDNTKDLTEIPDNILSSLEIIKVQWIDEVFNSALVTIPKPNIKTNKIDSNENITNNQVKTH